MLFPADRKTLIHHNLCAEGQEADVFNCFSTMYDRGPQAQMPSLLSIKSTSFNLPLLDMGFLLKYCNISLTY